MARYRKLDLVPGKGYADGPKSAGVSKLDPGLHLDKLLAMLRQGAKIVDALDAVNVSLRQHHYKLQHDKAYRGAVDAAKERGRLFRLLGRGDRYRRFLVACEWFGSIDVAREAVGITRKDLARLFRHNPGFRLDAVGWMHAGRMDVAKEGEAPLRKMDIGRAYLVKAVDAALIWHELEGEGVAVDMPAPDAKP